MNKIDLTCCQWHEKYYCFKIYKYIQAISLRFLPAVTPFKKTIKKNTVNNVVKFYF